jgi:N-formylglutamate deformylase
MFDGELGIAADAPSSRVAAGLGVIPRIVRDGAEIYRGKLLADEAEERLANLYRPYHAALADLVAETREQFGTAIVIDCHSMPSASAAPDIVLGDRYGAAAPPLLTRHADIAFQRCGFSVARNAPYAGGYTTLVHGRRERDVHALQIEINRALYLDEEHVQRGPRFEEIHAAVTEALTYLATIDASQFRRRTGPITRFAAE